MDCRGCIYYKNLADNHCIGCDGSRYTKPTNYDLLIRKSPEELAKWLGLEVEACNKNEKCSNDYTCDACWLEWLKEECV